MRPYSIIASAWLIGLSLCGVCKATAEDKVPCLIFTGKSDIGQCIDLEKLSRITFGDDGMTLSLSADNGIREVQLLYSLFNHIEIGDAVPSDPSAVDEIVIDTDPRIVFVPVSKTIVVESASEIPYSIGIFSLNGTLIATSGVYAGQPLSVASFAAGMYIAVATDGESQLTLKFILN